MFFTHVPYEFKRTYEFGNEGKYFFYSISQPPIVDSFAG